jgi:hypothetical protein
VVDPASGQFYPSGVQGPPESVRCKCGWIVQASEDDIDREVEAHTGPEGLEVIYRRQSAGRRTRSGVTGTRVDGSQSGVAGRADTSPSACT